MLSADPAELLGCLLLAALTIRVVRQCHASGVEGPRGFHEALQLNHSHIDRDSSDFPLSAFGTRSSAGPKYHDSPLAKN